LVPLASSSPSWSGDAPLGGPKGVVGGRVTRAPARDRTVQKAYGLALQLGVVARQRLQLRLSRFVHREGNREKQNLLILIISVVIKTQARWDVKKE
jgi:hypothetical protein